MRVGVIGDIHGNLSGLEKAIRAMGPVDQLLFTGDGYREIVRVGNSIAGFAVKGVIGNCDFYSEYPGELFFNLDRYQVMLTHGHLYGVKQGLTRIGLAGREKKADLIIFGHTHVPLSSEWEGIKLFNPGTLCPERAPYGVNYGIILIDQGGISCLHERL